MVDEMLKGKQGVASYYFNSERDKKTETLKKIAVYYPVRVPGGFWSIVVAASEEEALHSLVEFRNRLLLIFIFFLMGGVAFSYYGMKAWGIVNEEKKRLSAEKALRQSEERFRALSEQSMVGIGIVDNNRLVYANESMSRLGDYDLSELLEINFAELAEIVHPEDFESVKSQYEHLLNESVDFVAFNDFRIIAKTGLIRWITLYASRINLEDSSSVVFSALDITERKISEQTVSLALREKEVLLKEIHHRVKNNLQTVISLINLQKRDESDDRVEGVLNDIQNRIAAMSLVHESLYRTDNLSEIDFTQYLKRLTASLMDSQRPHGRRITLNADIQEGMTISIDQAVPCGLVINELVTNAFKHAFPGDRTGEIRIIVKTLENNDFRVVVRDNGAGLPANLDLRRVDSLGLSLSRMLIEGQLQGSFNSSCNGTTEFTVQFQARPRYFQGAPSPV